MPRSSPETDRQPAFAAVQPKTCGLAVASLVLGIIGCTAPFAVICGHIAKSRIRKSGGTLKGSGLATVGLVLGYVTIIGAIACIIASVYFGANMRKLLEKETLNMRQPAPEVTPAQPDTTSAQ
ncbi:MAG: hypothetical protein C0404_07225 [Verrucomicrobia bacterium]|nr:hypothetical protein [Verrucomicrobiota bacterium]